MSKEKEVKKNDIAKDFVKILGDLEGVAEVEKMIKDNKIEFDIDDVKYRVRQPTYEENMEIEKCRRKKYIEFMDDNSMMFRDQWIEKYKTKNIDIRQMERNIIELQNKIEQVMIRLAQTTNEEGVAKLKGEIIGLRTEQATLNIEKTDMLSYSIEDQLMVVVNSYYTYLVLEKLVEVKDKDNQWVRVFKDFDEFSKSTNSKLINKAFVYVNNLIYNLGI